MSRLYYKPKNPTTVPAGATTANMPAPTPSRSKEYLEKVAKIIPAEIIAGYLALIGFVNGIKNEDLHQDFYYGSFFLCLLLTPIYLYFQADKSKPKAIHIILSTISFIVWAYSISGEKVVPDFFDSAIASMVLVVYSLITGTIPLK
jgi:hypothetical protein